MPAPDRGGPPAPRDTRRRPSSPPRQKRSPPPPATRARAKKLSQAARGIQNREGIESHLLDGSLDRLDLLGIFHPHADRGIGGLIAESSHIVAQVRSLHDVQILRQLQRQKHSGSRSPAHTV